MDPAALKWVAVLDGGGEGCGRAWAPRTALLRPTVLEGWGKETTPTFFPPNAIADESPARRAKNDTQAGKVDKSAPVQESEKADLKQQNATFCSC